MSNLYTVTTLTEGEKFPFTVAHFDYQDLKEAETSTRENEAMKKWHHESWYKRSVGGFFKCYIEDENGEVVENNNTKIIDSSDKTGASESRLFSLFVTVETEEGIETEPVKDFSTFNEAMIEFHNACESKRSNDNVISYVARIENEWGAEEIKEKYSKGV